MLQSQPFLVFNSRIEFTRTKISFEILRALDVNGRARSLLHRKQSEVLDDFSLNVEATGIF